MIAYNPQWLNNLLLRAQAEKAAAAHCISEEEKQAVFAAHPAGFYTPNVFVRVGLFILTVVILVFGMGLISLLFLSSGSEKIFGGMFVFFGLCFYGGLELMVSKNHYRSGVDDALLWTSAACIIGGINALGPVAAEVNAVIVFFTASFLFLRFTNAVMAAIAALSLLALLFLVLTRWGPAASAITPFVLMPAAALLYFLSKKLLRAPQWKQYTDGLMLVAITALVCIYVAGNYFVVREASIEMFNLSLAEGQDIPLGWLFWLFTLAIPLLYILRGIQQKDAVLLRVGLLLVAAIVFTVRYYYHVLPAETAMVLGGILFIAIAYALIKYLHTPKHGFTYKEQKADKNFMDRLQVESLVIAQTFSGPVQPGSDTGTRFGGGSGGGGGATGDF